MNVILKTREKQHVMTFFERTQDEEIKSCGEKALQLRQLKVLSEKYLISLI